MCLSLFPGSAHSRGLPHENHASGSNPGNPTFTPFGKYVDVGSHEIMNTHPGSRFHVGSASTLHLNKGTLLGKDITYISQVWCAWDAQSTQEFYEQVLPYIHPDALRPLMGICVPTVIGLYSASGGSLSLAMELPHPVGWHEADPYIYPEQKEQVIVAYQNLHARNILHNDVKLENVLIGDDGKVTIVDFCKMVTNAEPTDLALEMRAIKFTLDYDGAKKTEYERLQRVESRVRRNLRRSRLRRRAKDKGLTDEVEPDELPSQDEIDCPPFSRTSLKRWDSEVYSEGTTHCIGWLGRRFQVPEDMQLPPWPGIKDYTPPTPPPYQPIDFAALVKGAFRREPFGSHVQWMKRCHYLPFLWSPPESTVSDDEESSGTSSSSSSSTSSGPSDYGSCSEDSLVTDTELPKRDRSTPPSPRKRLRAEDFTRLDDCTRENTRQHGLKSLEPEHEVDPASWTTRRVKGLDPPPPLWKRREREGLPSLTPPRESSPSEAGLPALADLSPNPRKPVRCTTRSLKANPPPRRASTSGDSGWPPSSRSFSSSRRSSVAASPRGYHPWRKSERKCSVIVKDSDGEDQVWVMSREALEDVRGYLQVKKAKGVAMEVRSGGEESDVRHLHLRADRILHTTSTRPTKKRTSPECGGEEKQKQKRPRSWPDTNLYASESHTGSLLCSG